MTNHRRTHIAAIWTALLAIAAALVAGCGDGGSEAQAPPEPKGSVLGLESTGQELALATDDILTIRLPGQASTGYTWEVEEVDGKLLKQEAKEAEQPSLLGGVGAEILRFSGVAQGTTTLKLAYRRPWERGTGLQSFSAKVNVAGRYTGAYAARPKASARALSAAEATASGLPSLYKICDAGGGCTPVRNQASCGDCWAFATAGVFENVLSSSTGASYDLSEQYVTSCNPWGWGCGGGDAAFDLYLGTRVASEGDAGAVYEGDDPFASADGEDRACGSAHPHHEKLRSWARINGHSPSVVEIKQAMLQHGPIFTGVCANDFGSYPGGIFRGGSCGSNHAVVLTGWNDNGGDGYWYLRNSWGSGWGEGGYMRISYGAAAVGSDAAYVVYDGYTPRPSNALQFDSGDGNAASPAEWDSGYFKGDCGSCSVPTGLSQKTDLSTAHALLCAPNCVFTGNGVTTVTDVSNGDHRRASRAGDWDPGHYKSECGLNEYVSGVSMDPSSKKLHGLRCASASLANGGAGDCETRLVTQEDRGDSAYGDWDFGYFKGQCSAGKVIYGVSTVPSTGKPHRILCCSF